MQVGPRGSLQLDGRSFFPHRLSKTAAQDATPPSLDGDGALPKVLVLLVGDPTTDILLNKGDQCVQAGCAEGLEKGNHASPEEDLGKADLILVLVLECPLQEQLAEGFNVRIPLPLLGVD